MTRKFIILVGLLALLFTAVPVLAGGWVVITLDSLPEDLQADRPVAISFMVRHHGKEPTHDVSPFLTATNKATGEEIRIAAEKAPETNMPNLELSDIEIEALIAFLSAPYETGKAADQTHTCAITQPPNQPFNPPAPYSPGSPYEDHFWYGIEKLWTLLPFDGLWRDLPRDEAGFGQKVFWWREGYDWREEPLPTLTVTARRLDGTAPSFESSEATNGFHPDLDSFMLTGVTIPTAGCWQITAQHQGQELSFIVQVSP